MILERDLAGFPLVDLESLVKLLDSLVRDIGGRCASYAAALGLG